MCVCGGGTSTEQEQGRWMHEEKQRRLEASTWETRKRSFCVRHAHDRGMLLPATLLEDTQRNRGRSGDIKTAEDEQAMRALQL